LIGSLIAEGKATLHELNTVYTLEDAIDIYEAVATMKFNEYTASKYAQDQTKAKGG
jgi:hypothetical protein